MRTRSRSCGLPRLHPTYLAGLQDGSWLSRQGVDWSSSPRYVLLSAPACPATQPHQTSDSLASSSTNGVTRSMKLRVVAAIRLANSSFSVSTPISVDTDLGSMCWSESMLPRLRRAAMSSHSANATKACHCPAGSCGSGYRLIRYDSPQLLQGSRCRGPETEQWKIGLSRT